MVHVRAQPRPTPTCKTYSTHSTHAAGTVGYFYNDKPAPTTADMLGYTGSEEIMIYDWYSGHLSLLAATNNIAPGYEGHIYAVTAPIVSGWAFIGEVDKYVTASKLRFPEVTTSGGKLTATVSVVAGETVKVCAAQASTYKLTCQMASKNGTVTFG